MQVLAADWKTKLKINTAVLYLSGILLLYHENGLSMVAINHNTALMSFALYICVCVCVCVCVC